MGSELIGEDQIIKAQVPQAELLKYSQELKGITGVKVLIR